MKRPILLLVSILAIAALACTTGVNVNVPRVTTGPTETLSISEPRPGGDTTANVTLRMGAGTLEISGGGEGLLQGSVRYNVPDWKPALTNNNGTLTLEQGHRDEISGLPGSNIINEWDLKFGDAPMTLTIEAGAYKGDIDLSGLRLKGLNVTDGASEAEVHFDTLNPVQMDNFTYTTGASSLKLTGLGNANFTNLVFKGGAGSFTLDFAGLQRDANVSVDAAASQVTLIIPAGARANVVLSGGLTNVDPQGTWTHTANTYGTGTTGPLLTIDAKMGVGNLILIAK